MGYLPKWTQIGMTNLLSLRYLFFIVLDDPEFDSITRLMIENGWHDNTKSAYNDVIEIMGIIV